MADVKYVVKHIGVIKMKVEKRKRGKKEYIYLNKSIRIGGKVKTFSNYIGPVDKISKGQLGRDIEFNKKEMEKDIKRFKDIFATLEDVLSSEERKVLEKIRHRHQKRQTRLTKIQKLKLGERFGIKFTYDSNAIEGSTVSEEEVYKILKDKITPHEKTLIEVRETENHMRAFDYLLMEEDSKITKALILKIHKIMSEGLLGPEEGVFRKGPVSVAGSKVERTKPENISSEINGLLRWYGKARKKHPPIEAIAAFHSKFEKIHPFRDYNGRTGRLLVNYMLKYEGFPPITISIKKRSEYYDALEADHLENNLRPIVKLIYGVFVEMYTGKTEWNSF